MTPINQRKDKKYLLTAFIAEGIAALLIAITLFIFFIIGIKINSNKCEDYDYHKPYYDNFDYNYNNGNIDNSILF